MNYDIQEKEMGFDEFFITEARLAYCFSESKDHLATSSPALHI